MKKEKIFMIIFISLALIPINANATTITFSTPLGATESGGNPVSSLATFVTGAGTIDITLANTLNDPTAIAQNLSDLAFLLSTGQTAGTLTSSSGLERNVASNGTYTDGSLVSTGWALETITLPFSGLRLHVLGTLIGPAHTIIGGPAADNTYDSANSSIAGNDPHNPFLVGPVTFLLSVPGVTENTTVTGVFFSYGTTEGNNVRVPEPTGLLLLGVGLVAFWGARRKLK